MVLKLVLLTLLIWSAAAESNCSYSARDDLDKAGEISFYIMLLFYIGFCAFAGYTTHQMFWLHKSNEVNQTYMQMFYIAADLTLVRKSFFPF